MVFYCIYICIIVLVSVTFFLFSDEAFFVFVCLFVLWDMYLSSFYVLSLLLLKVANIIMCPIRSSTSSHGTQAYEENLHAAHISSPKASGFCHLCQVCCYVVLCCCCDVLL